MESSAVALRATANEGLFLGLSKCDVRLLINIGHLPDASILPALLKIRSLHNFNYVDKSSRKINMLKTSQFVKDYQI